MKLLAALTAATVLSGCALAGSALEAAERSVADGGLVQGLCSDAAGWVREEASSPAARTALIAALESTRDALGKDPAGVAARAELDKAIAEARKPGTDLGSGLGMLDSACQGR